MLKWIKKLTEKLYLKANPDYAVVSKAHLEELENIANAPIMPEYHVYERFHTDLVPVQLEASRYIYPDEYAEFSQCDNYTEVLANALLTDMMPCLLKKILISIDFNQNRGLYEARGYFKFWEKEQ